MEHFHIVIGLLCNNTSAWSLPGTNSWSEQNIAYKITAKKSRKPGRWYHLTLLAGYLILVSKCLLCWTTSTAPRSCDLVSFESKISVLGSFTRTTNPSTQDLWLNVPTEGQSNNGEVSCSRTQVPRLGLEPTLYWSETPELESGEWGFCHLLVAIWVHSNYFAVTITL